MQEVLSDSSGWKIKIVAQVKNTILKKAFILEKKIHKLQDWHRFQ